MTAPLPQPCQQWRLQLAAAHPADLEPAERAALEGHLATCASCAAVSASYARLDAAVQRLPAPAPLADVPPKLLALWAAEDRQAQGTAPGSLARREEPLRQSTREAASAPIFPQRFPPRRSRRMVSGLAALAAVLVIVLLAAALLASRLHSAPAIGGPRPQQSTVPTLATSQPTPTSSLPTATSTPAAYPVLVYFSRHPASDSDPTAVFPVHRVSPTLGVATYALEQLFLGPTADEQSQGYYSELMGNLGSANHCSDPSKDFTLSLNHRGPTPEAGTATVTLCVPVALPGDLSGPRVEAMITQTLLQFANIKQVVILNDQGNCFGDLRGGNACLQG